VVEVPVAEVKAEFDLVRNDVGDADEPLDDPVLHVLERRLEPSLPHPHLDGDVPLKREPLMRDVIEDATYLIQ
jgi:hypothetical protein